MKQDINKYVIFIDIDGTLMGNSQNALFENLAAIQKIRSLGHKVFINTGRATAYLPADIDPKRNFDGIISGAGALVKFEDKEISRKLMPSDLVEKFSNYVLENRLQGFLEGEKNMYHFGFSDKAETEWIEINVDNIEQLLAEDLAVEKFTVLGEIPAEVDKLMGETCAVIRHPYYGEIIQRSCGKGTALLDVMNFLGIPKENSIAIGDSMNDYDMIKAAGLGVAMGNASKEIKDIADMITEDVDKAGVSAALRKIFSV